MIDREGFAQIRKHMPIINDPHAGLDVKIANLLEIRAILSHAEYRRIAETLYKKAEDIWEQAQKLDINRN